MEFVPTVLIFHSLKVIWPLQVHAKEVNKFQLAYAAILKTNMDNLKKRERKTAVETKSKPISTKKAVKV